MRLVELIPHTSTWTGVPDTQVNSVARVLRPAGLLSSAGTGPRAAEMTNSDKVNLLLGACGVETANRAADYVRIWRRAFKSHMEPKDDLFEFMKADTVEDLLINLLTKDLRGGQLEKMFKDSRYASITLDLHLDAFALDLTVEVEPYTKGRMKYSLPQPIVIRFAPPPPPYDIPLPRRLSEEYHATSDLIRRLYAKNLIGWGLCLD